MQQSNECSNAFETPVSEGRKLRECPKHLIEYNVICPRCRLEDGDSLFKKASQVFEMQEVFTKYLLKTSGIEHYSILAIETKLFALPIAMEYLTGSLDAKEAMQRAITIRRNIAFAIKIFIEAQN